MKIKALITALILGSSSVAMARPATFTAEASWSFNVGTNRPVVRDNRRPVYQRPVQRPVHQPPVYQPVQREPLLFPKNTVTGHDSSSYTGPRPSLGRASWDDGRYGARAWVSITQPTRIDMGRQFIHVGEELGRFRQLSLQNAAGYSVITQIVIVYKDGGQNETLAVNQRLDRNNPTIDLDLRGSRIIDGVIVYGETGYGSAYSLLAK